MKVDLLKKLIKEAVREAVREELRLVLEEPAKSTPEIKSEGFTKYTNYKPVKSTYISKGDPVADLLEETRQGMISGPTAGSSNMDISQMVSAPGIGMQSMVMEDNFARPEPGLDISQFDFIKKAGAIYRASNEKDKQRYGA